MNKIICVIMITLVSPIINASEVSNVVDEHIWIGSKIYDRVFGRGCGSCHDISSNPNLLESVKTLSKKEFFEVLTNGRKGMPKAVDAIMSIKLVKKKHLTDDHAMEAVYQYLKGRSDGTIPEGKLKKKK